MRAPGSWRYSGFAGFENYSAVFNNSPIGSYILNSFKVTIPTVIVAGVAVMVVSAVRAVASRGIESDLWMLAGVVPLIAAGVLLSRRSDRAVVLTPWAVSAGLALAALLGAVGLVLDRDAVRGGLIVAAIAAVGVAWRGRYARVLAWTGIGLAAALALVAVGLGVQPPEAFTAPVALALVVEGARRLHRDPRVRSWPALGIGLVLLVVPSLVFDFAARNELWRVIALGAAALVILLAGVRWRLQAPVLIGGVVLLVHAVAQLWPWITALYESVSGLWWLWLGIAGVLLIVVAATYERRIRELRSAALAIRALR